MKMAIVEEENNNNSTPIENGDEYNLSEILDRNDDESLALDLDQSPIPLAANTSYVLAKS